MEKILIPLKINLSPQILWAVMGWLNKNLLKITDHIGYVLERSRAEKFENGVDH